MKNLSRIALIIAGTLLAGAVFAQGDKRSIHSDEVLKIDDSSFGSVRKVYDDRYEVTCWVFIGYKKGGISCLPNSQLIVREVRP